MKKYGFIYVWYDKKRKMFYIGSHWGTVDDGYICSSNRMRDAYRRRPQDFKRRIIARDINREALLEEEHKWLSKIPDKELGKRYYNIRKHKWGHWSTDENTRKTVGQKISASPNRSKKISAALKGKFVGDKSPLFGVPRTEEWKKKFSENHPKPMLDKKHSDETKRKMSLANLGKPKTEKQVIKSTQSRTGMKRSLGTRMRMSEAQKGTKKPWAGGQIGRKDTDQARENKRRAALIREHKKRKLRFLREE